MVAEILGDFLYVVCRMPVCTVSMLNAQCSMICSDAQTTKTLLPIGYRSTDRAQMYVCSWVAGYKRQVVGDLKRSHRGSSLISAW